MSQRMESKTAVVPEAREEVRCHCGKLIARLVPGGVEIRCQRCKRAVVVPLEGGPHGGGQVEGQP